MDGGREGGRDGGRKEGIFNILSFVQMLKIHY
jgi:hypothetical protein